MRLMAPIAISAILLVLFGPADSEIMDKPEATDFLTRIRRRRESNRLCGGRKCAFEEDADMFDDKGLGEELLHLYLFRTLLQRMKDSSKHQDQSSKRTESASESRMIDQEPLLTSLPPDRTSH